MPASIVADKATITPANATASVTFGRDGTIKDQDGSNLGAWISPAHPTIGDNYKVKFDRTGGSHDLSSYPSGGSDDVYVALTSDRTFSNTQTVVGVRSSTGTFTVADTAETESDSASGSITAEEA